MNEAANLLSILLLHRVRFLGIVVFPLINNCFAPQPINYLQRVKFLRGCFFGILSIMKHIDTLAKYEEFKATGMPDEQARSLVKAWAEAYDMSREGLATKSDLDVMETKLESKMDANFRIVYIIGGAIFTICCLPVLQKFI